MIPQRWKTPVAALAVAIVATLVYIPGLPGDFVYDDHRLIVDNDGLKRPFEPGRAFLRDYYASDLDRTGLGYYRPITLLTNELDYRRGGGGSLAFHLSNIAFHVVATLLVFVLIWMLVGTALAATFGAALFAVHASHAESVAFISGRVDPLATLFVLAALALHLRANRSPSAVGLRIAAGAAWLGALLSKEIAVTGAVLVCLVELSEEGWPRAGERWSRVRRYLPFAAALAIYLALRAAALGKLLASSGEAPPLSVIKPLLVVGSYLAWLVMPPRGLHLEPAPVGGLAMAAACAVTVVAVAAALALWRTRWRREGALIAAVLVALLPVAQLKPLETVLSERFLYLPSAFVAILAGSLVKRALAYDRTAGTLAAIAIGALALLHVSILEPRAVAWRDELALWSAKELEDGGSLKARLNLGQVHARRGDREESSRWYERAKEIAPNLAESIDAEMASLTGELGSDASESAMLKGLEATPEDGSLWSNLAFHRFQKGDPAAAVQAFERSIAITPNRASAWLGLALARLALRDYKAAETAAARASALDPELGLARAILAECALRDGRPCEALRLCAGVALSEPSERATLERIVAAARASCPAGADADQEGR